MRGSVTPVTGNRPTTTLMLINACVTKAKLKPALRRPPNGLSDLINIFNPL